MNKDNGLVSVSVVGASGYVGGELLRLLLSHPRVELKSVVSETYNSKPLSAAFPGMVFSDIKFSSFNRDYIVNNSDLVFFAQDHGAAIKSIPEFIRAGCRVIDLSADFRLKNPEIFQKWYKQEHTALEDLKHAVYGLPELFRKQIRSASLVANPGCYPTASALALIPLLKKDLISSEGIVIDAKSGVSGAGRAKHSLDLHFPELNQNFRAYSVGGAHRHTPEIEQTLGYVSGQDIVLSFTPHLLPITRGILASCYANLKLDLSYMQVFEIFSEFYKDEPFVRVLDQGQLPSTKACYGSNLCLIGFAIDSRTKRISVFSAIDNLTKGASGQALQNFNIMFGFDESLGLSGAALWP